MAKCGGAWFAATKNGSRGNRPVAWQGWVALGVYILLAFAAAFGLPHGLKFPAVIGLLIAYVVISALKTEGGWRGWWGKDR